MTPLTCDEVRAAAPELVLGTLDGAERAAVVDHLGSCPRCREEVAALAGTVSDLAVLAPPMAPSAGFTDRVLEAGGVTGSADGTVVDVRAAPSPVRRRRWPVLLAAAAAVVALAVGVLGRDTSTSTGAVAFSAMITPDGAVIGSMSDVADGAVAITVSYPSNWRDYTVEAVHLDGTTTSLGPLSWTDGAWRWQGDVPGDGSVDRLRVVRPDGKVTCWGRLPSDA